MRNIFGKTTYILLTFIQLSLISISFVIDNLTKKKAGVNHHIIYKRVQYENGIFSSNNLSIQSIIVASIGILFIILLINAIRNKKSFFHRIQVFLGVTLSLLLVFVINSSTFIDKLGYPYFIIAFEIAFLIQIVIITLVSFIRKY